MCGFWNSYRKWSIACFSFELHFFFILSGTVIAGRLIMGVGNVLGFWHSWYRNLRYFSQKYLMG